jgi:hypothetical protein
MPSIKPPNAARKLSAIMAKAHRGAKPASPQRKLARLTKPRIQKTKGTK